ncbi:hypothetical protein EG68_01445 [Paragonimus skrjabini miyazakii]|uniref:Uncharacterized protein n=1 Tax=Paragonimus skrjabini miyazakii TaxID=59628 RepID=A0A8S9Z2Y9_9TREM|nr:hypothetical protein EG68_01445 [Paragonimus skrjabini miyazakii]
MKKMFSRPIMSNVEGQKNTAQRESWSVYTVMYEMKARPESGYLNTFVDVHTKVIFTVCLGFGGMDYA